MLLLSGKSQTSDNMVFAAVKVADLFPTCFQSISFIDMPLLYTWYDTCSRAAAAAAAAAATGDTLIVLGCYLIAIAMSIFMESCSIVTRYFDD